MRKNRRKALDARRAAQTRAIEDANEAALDRRAEDPNRLRGAVFDKAYAMGAAPRGAEALSAVFEMVPGLGEASGVEDTYQAASAGNYGGAALAGGLTALGALPFAPNLNRVFRGPADAGRSGMGGNNPPPEASDIFIGDTYLYSPSRLAARQVQYDGRQKKGTYEQIRAALLKAGAKEEELAFSGFDQAFKGRPSMTVDEAVEFLDENTSDIITERELESAGVTPGRSERVDGWVGRVMLDREIRDAALNQEGIFDEVSQEFDYDAARAAWVDEQTEDLGLVPLDERRLPDSVLRGAFHARSGGLLPLEDPEGYEDMLIEAELGDLFVGAPALTAESNAFAAGPYPPLGDFLPRAEDSISRTRDTPADSPGPLFHQDDRRAIQTEYDLLEETHDPGAYEDDFHGFGGSLRRAQTADARRRQEGYWEFLNQMEPRERAYELIDVHTRPDAPDSTTRDALRFNTPPSEIPPNGDLIGRTVATVEDHIGDGPTRDELMTQEFNRRVDERSRQLERMDPAELLDYAGYDDDTLASLGTHAPLDTGWSNYYPPGHRGYSELVYGFGSQPRLGTRKRNVAHAGLEDPNMTLGHARVSRPLTVDGEPVLHMGETQSDYLKRMYDENDLRKRDGEPLRAMATPEEEFRLRELATASDENGVSLTEAAEGHRLKKTYPAAPKMQSSNTMLDMMLRRNLDRATREDLSGITFAPPDDPVVYSDMKAPAAKHLYGTATPREANRLAKKLKLPDAKLEQVAIEGRDRGSTKPVLRFTLSPEDKAHIRRKGIPTFMLPAGALSLGSIMAGEDEEGV